MNESISDEVAYQELIEKNHNLIYHCLIKFNLEESEYYDLFAIALCVAAQTYREDCGAGFAHYAITCMTNALHSEIKYQKYQCRNRSLVKSLSEFANEDGKEDLTLAIQDRRDIVKEVIFLDSFERVYKKCSEQQRRCLCLIASGYSQTEAAEIMGVSSLCINLYMKKIRSRFAFELAS